jgi:predicted DNA-binding protein
MRDKKKSDSKETSITFRTTKELKEKLENFAYKESRTVSNMIELLLQKELETVKSKK